MIAATITLIAGYMIGLTHGLDIADGWRVRAWRRERLDLNPALRRKS